MPRHIFRLILFIVACGVVGYGAKRFFTVNSFYEYGHYQGRFGSGHRLGQAEIQRRGILRVMPCGPTHGMVQRRTQQHRHRKDR